MLASPEETAPVIFIVLGVGFLALGVVAFIRESRQERKDCLGTILLLVGAAMFLGAGLLLHLLTQEYSASRTRVSNPAYLQDYDPGGSDGQEGIIEGKGEL